ncbi:hypothetical protein CENSYa_1260 [Cenarchaeum symbiosum A]|uniref:Uncharacterized protein n=1 Tax=Cenarchaeum symbiosum (strain A) TaxID=414004 RepID=A0RX16_CENSY|nr:hypothetical protein CENSYa_1260 [Cenarchaeum symbiosum A]
MSEFKRISLLDRNYQEVDSISEAVHILAQIGNEMTTRRVAPGEPDGLAIAYTPNHERHEIE